MMKRILRASHFPLLLGVLALVAPAAFAAEGPIEIEFSPDKVEFFPNTPWKLAQLTVTGPECLYLDLNFRVGERIAFTPFDASGEPLPDGVYSWNLKLGPAAQVRGLNEPYGEGQLCRGRENLPPLDYLTSTGYISILDVRFVDPFIEEDRQIADAARNGGAESNGAGGTPVVVAGAQLGGPASEGGAVRSMSAAATVLTNGDGVIRNSLCVGFDCPNNPTFGDTTVLLMENNTRIKFDDTSSISGFPNRDWEIEANSAQSGGLSYFGVNDCGGTSQGNCTTDLVFLIEANAPANSLRVDDGGRVGFGTGSPVVELHVLDGDTPALRLEQDGSSGFAPQTWDVAGNETNFFVRDVTGGSQLPFRIQPGTASNTLFLDADDRVGIGTTSPTDKLHVRSTTGVASILVEEASGTLDNNRVLVEVVNNGRAQFRLRNTADTSGLSWFVSHETNGNFAISREGTGVAEVTVEPDGDMIITGNYTPDYVFDPGYELMPLAELEEFIARERHLPNVPNAAEVEKNGINVNDFPMALLEKIEELALHTIAQQKTIDALQAEVAQLKTARAD
jgi:hypothetical protein